MARVKFYNPNTGAWEYADGTGSRAEAAANTYLPLVGGALNGALSMNNYKITSLSDPTSLTDATNKQYVDNAIANASTSVEADTTSTKTYVVSYTGTATDPLKYNSNVYINNANGVMFGAAWNDYAEYRQTTEPIEAGRVICENNDDTLSLSKERLQPGANIVSDTFGFAMGETDKAKTPIALAGRVLAYPYEDRNIFMAGDAVCAGPNGTVSKMSREEIMMYPERIIGTVSAVPNYEFWGEHNIPVNGRIWIKIK